MAVVALKAPPPLIRPRELRVNRSRAQVTPLKPMQGPAEPDAPPPIVTVFVGVQGGIHHARCGRRIGYQGSRGGQELDFYCLECREHITLPEIVLPRLPVGTGVAERRP
jgi:hypothetical protein